MKKVILLMAISFTSMAFAQDDDTNCEVMEITPYVATGISIPNTVDFSADAYMSVEFGVMFDNFTVAGVFGVNNLESFGNINGY